MMTIDHALGIIRRELKRSGYDVTERKSLTTKSVYFDVSNIDVNLCFRVSDHSTVKNVITLRVDMIKNEAEVVGFVRNRIGGLRKRSMKRFYGI